MANKIEHIGIFVTNLEESIRRYGKALGLSVSVIEDYFEDGKRLRLAFLPIGECCLELIEAVDAGDSAPPPGIDHIAVEVDDIDADCATLRSAGLRLEPDGVMPGSRGTRVAFVRPADMGNVSFELVEPAKA
jgi:methylmalonyl-CoA/ethylmalonyl-CoA epimerase